jgi:acyl-coenzyme A thioesterase PaaI-like protein
MLAVNEPFVVLAAATTKFLKPAQVGETLVAEAVLSPGEGRKRIAEVTVSRDGTPVFAGQFTCVTLDKHVLG